MEVIRIARPFIPWVGGKEKMIPLIVQLFPPEIKTSESFCQGGAWIFFILLTQILSLLLPE